MLDPPDPERDAGAATVGAVAELEPLVCAACGTTVTWSRDRVERFGAHVHDRVNPAGVVFRIGCFRAAEGAHPAGPSHSEFAWFPRHRWQIGLCAGCRAHLGWRFVSAEGAFWGLILDALRAGAG